MLTVTISPVEASTLMGAQRRIAEVIGVDPSPQAMRVAERYNFGNRESINVGDKVVVDPFNHETQEPLKSVGKIDKIKEFRERWNLVGIGIGLKDAKDYVERYY